MTTCDEIPDDVSDHTTTGWFSLFLRSWIDWGKQLLFGQFYRNLTVRQLVALGISVPFLLMVLVGCLQWQAVHRNGALRERVTQGRVLLFNLESYLSLVKDAETGQRGYLLTHNTAYLDPYYRAVNSTNGQIAGLRQLTMDSPEQQRNLDQLERLANVKFQEIATTISKEEKKDHKGALKVLKTDVGKNTMIEISMLIARMQTTETILLKKREDAYKQNSRVNSYLSIVLMGLGSSFLFTIIFLLLRLEQIKQMVTICAWSKMIEHEGQWLTVEQYLAERLKVKITHGISKAEAKKMQKMIEKEKAQLALQGL